MQARELMTPLMITVNADAPVAAAAELMRNHDVGFLPVREGGEVVGVVTDRDITVRGAAEGADLTAMPVSAAMTRDVVSVGGDATPDEALRLMVGCAVTRLLVTDDDGRPVGVLSERDLPGQHPR